MKELLSWVCASGGYFRTMGVEARRLSLLQTMRGSIGRMTKTETTEAYWSTSKPPQSHAHPPAHNVLFSPFSNDPSRPGLLTSAAPKVLATAKNGLLELRIRNPIYHLPTLLLRKLDISISNITVSDYAMTKCPSGSPLSPPNQEANPEKHYIHLQ